jgi:DNA-binding NarL/FixJ family response regulator
MLATIIIADDDQAFRSVLKRLLQKERELSVVGEAADGLEAIERARELSPDIILMDIAMPRLNGLEATRRIRAEHPEIKVVIFTKHQEDAYRQAAADSGADAFLTKTTRLADLLTTIRQVSEGGPDEPIG